MGSNKFRFFRAGGVDQVQIKTGRDLVALKELDQKLWVALSCPVSGLHLDERTLSLIDSDKDGRVRAPELLRAIEWAASLLKDPDELGRSDKPLDLATLNTDNELGKLLHTTARSLLDSLGKADESSISVEDSQKALLAFSKQPKNGDGILPPSALTDPLQKAAGAAIVASLTNPPVDRSSEPGFKRDDVVAFFASAKERLAWLESGKGEAISVLGDKTEAAYQAYQAVAPKIEDFFTRVRVVSFDSRALIGMNREEAKFLELGLKTLSRSAAEMKDFPLAHIQPGSQLPLVGGLNPAWLDAVQEFNDKVVRPILGERTSISEADFLTMGTRLSPYAEWFAKAPGGTAASVPKADLEAWVQGQVEPALLDAIKKDEDAAAEWGAIEHVETLARYKRDLLTLANNFVSFRDFYRPDKRATFQVGTLLLDQRALDLVLSVNDPAKHTALGPLSAIYLVYCDIKNASEKPRSIVAGITDGDVDNLMVGRNGVFYDRTGKDWDATITRIVDAPVSVRQAFLSPYKKLIRLVEDQVNKRAANAAAKSDEDLLAKASAAEGAVAEGQKPAVAAPPKKLDIGVVAAIGVAVGGITAALGAFLQAFLGLGIWMPLGVLAVILLISGPSMAIAWLKLRRRNLGPLLDANGWAINVMPRINVPLGKSFTQLAELPPGASRDLVDPFAEAKSPWKSYLFLLVLIGLGISWFMGIFDSYLPHQVKRSTVLGHAPKAAPKTP
jgi:hypothetical protein